MEENTKDIKRTVKIALKTLGDCFIAIMMALAIIFVAFPSFSLKIHKSLGMKKMQELDYQIIYAKSDNIADLYNLILFEQQSENTEKELFYIDKIIERKDYSEFCASMDMSTMNKLTDKRLIAYSANINGYLLSRKVTIMYNSEIKDLSFYVYKQTKAKVALENTFSSFVNLVYKDETLSLNDKKTIFEQLISINEGSGKIENFIDDKIDNIKQLINNESNEKQQWVYKGVLLRIYDANASLYEVLGDETKKNENIELYNNIRTEIYA